MKVLLLVSSHQVAVSFLISSASMGCCVFAWVLAHVHTCTSVKLHQILSHGCA